MYDVKDVPDINSLLSFQTDEINNRVVCSIAGELKILYCSPVIFEKVLSFIDGGVSFGDLESIFLLEYSTEQVRNFISTLLNEEIIQNINPQNKLHMPKTIVIGTGVISNEINAFTKVSITEFLQDNFCGDFDMAIFAPDICTYKQAMEVNKKLYLLNKPYTQIYNNGDELLAGPLVIPRQSACLECLVTSKIKKINKNIQLVSGMSLNLEEIFDINYSNDTSDAQSDSSIAFIVNKVGEEMINYYNNKPSNLLDFQYKIQLNHKDEKERMNITKEEKRPVTACKFCNGMNENLYRVSSKEDFDFQNFELKVPEVLKPSQIMYSTGGFRSMSQVETEIFIAKEIEKLGKKFRVERETTNTFEGVIPSCNTFVDEGRFPNSPYLFRKSDACGKGLTERQSYFSGMFELFEELNTQYLGDIPIIKAAYNTVKDYAVDLPSLAKTIQNEKTAYDDFNEWMEIDWVVMASLTNGEKKLVPAFLIFYTDVELDGVFFGSTSTGNGSAAILEDSILHALFEIIERDSWMIGQSNPHILPLVDYKSSKNEVLLNRIKEIEAMGYKVIIRDYTTDIGIPVFRTWIVEPDNYSRFACSGVGCHLSQEIALERSVTEAIQSYEKVEEVSYASVNQKFLHESRVNLYNQHFLVNKDILSQTDKITLIEQPFYEKTTSYDLIKEVSNRLKEKIGGDVYFLPLKKEGFDAEVVRVVATGNIQHHHYPIIAVSSRMFEFGIRCGYSNKLTTYEELYLGDYQM